MIPPRFMFDDMMDFAGPMPMVPGMAVPERARRPTFAPPLPAAAAASGSSDTVRVRQVFPESWLWSDVQSSKYDIQV